MVEAGGDADTTAAIVGGIVAAHTGIGNRGNVRGIPDAWLSARTPSRLDMRRAQRFGLPLGSGCHPCDTSGVGTNQVVGDASYRWTTSA